MTRMPMIKETENSRLLKAYASWIYCTQCEKTVAYLCYVTYDTFDFDYDCMCGGHGHVHIAFEHEPIERCDEPLVTIKNRLCCPIDESPLVTVVEKNLRAYRLGISCHACHHDYALAKTEQGD